MTTHAEQNVCCSDSALSIAANIIGILTFVLGLILTYFAYLVLSVNALQDIQTTRQDALRWNMELRPIIEHCVQEFCQDDSTFSQYSQQLVAALNQFTQISATMKQELDRFPKFDTTSSIPHAFQIRRRVIWVLRRQKIIGHMDQLMKTKSDIYSMFIAYLTQ